jgi:hypothetical protein
MKNGLNSHNPLETNRLSTNATKSQKPVVRFELNKGISVAAKSLTPHRRSSGH